MRVITWQILKASESIAGEVVLEELRRDLKKTIPKLDRLSRESRAMKRDVMRAKAAHADDEEDYEREKGKLDLAQRTVDTRIFELDEFWRVDPKKLKEKYEATVKGLREVDKKSWQVLGNAAPKGLIKMIGECACILWGKDPGQWSNAQFLFNASEKNSKLGDKDGIIHPYVVSIPACG